MSGDFGLRVKDSSNNVILDSNDRISREYGTVVTSGMSGFIDVPGDGNMWFCATAVAVTGYPSGVRSFTIYKESNTRIRWEFQANGLGEVVPRTITYGRY